MHSPGPLFVSEKLDLKASTLGSIRSRFGLALSQQLSGLRLEDYTCIPNYSFEWKKFQPKLLLACMHRHRHIFTHSCKHGRGLRTWSMFISVYVNWTHKGYGTYSGKFTLRKSVVLVVVSKVWWSLATAGLPYVPLHLRFCLWSFI